MFYTAAFGAANANEATIMAEIKRNFMICESERSSNNTVS
jgi:hypothetical protein